MSERSDLKLKAMLRFGWCSAWEQLHLPKNMEKGEFDKDLRVLRHQLSDEVMELWEAIIVGDMERVWCEAGDVINFASRIAEVAHESATISCHGDASNG